MNQEKRRNVPAELRPRFIETLKLLRSAQPEMSEDELWEYTAKIMHASLVKDWRLFQEEIGLNDNSYNDNYQFGDIDITDLIADICPEHGTFTVGDLNTAGILSGCPVCFEIDEESDRDECY